MSTKQRIPCPSEHAEQVALFQWRDLMAASRPELLAMFAIPNGGAREAITGAILKREGVSAGVPDVFLAVARGKRHGLFIEMKRKCGGVFGAAQKQWAERLKAQGYCHKLCCGAEVAIETIERYLQDGEVA